MLTVVPIFALAATAAVVGCGGATVDTQGAGAEVTALVSVAIVRAAPLGESLVAYGTVVAAPGSVRVLTAPFEAIVTRLLVSRGERVVDGQRLVQVAPSPEAKLLVEAAQSAVQAARGRMADVRQRLELGLTTRDELLIQQQALSDAEARWKTYSTWLDGLDLRAPGEGVIDRLPISEGQRVPAGDILLSVVAGGRFEAALGIEPEDASLVRVGQRVSVERLAGAPTARAVAGAVRSVSLAVDSATRLTVVLVAPNANAGERLLLGEYIRAIVEVRSATGLVVPRTSLLPQESGTALFVIRGDRAFRRLVTIGVETDSLVQVSGVDVRAGDTVVVAGNYELADSMRVRLSAGAAPDATSPKAPIRK